MTAARMPTRARVPGWVVLLSLALVLRSATDAQGDTVTPDRPSVSNSTETVPLGALQLETGLAHEATSAAGSPVERRTAWAVTLRAGLADGLEARLESEPLVHLRSDRDETGPGDVTLGLKYRFLDASDGGWPSLAVLPFVKLPTARVPLGSGRADFGIVLLASQALPAGFNLDVNAGAIAVGQGRPSGYLVQAVTSAALGYQLTESLSLYGETFWSSRGERGGRDALGVDAGFVYLLTPRVALDAAVETTLRGAGPDYGVKVGFSIRFGGR